MKIINWNVNGIRACERKGLIEFMLKEDADIYCLQETKISEDKLEPKFLQIKKYYAYFNFAEKKGYSGVAIYSKIKPINIKKGLGIEKFDREGRVLTLEFEKFFLINVYFPNSQHELKRLGYKLEFDKELLKFANNLKKQKHIIITGDFNVAHKEIDLKNPKANMQNPGFTIEERNAFSEFINNGYIDVFREFDKSPDKYTWWSYRFNARAKNIGWRIDYFLVDRKFMSFVKNCVILENVLGSDHCPIKLVLK